MKKVLKRTLATILMMVMLFLFVPWNNMKTFAAFDATVYAPVLDEYKEITALYNNGNREAVEDYLDKSEYIGYVAGVMFWQSISYRDDCSFLYALYDIDSNGVDEFIVGFNDHGRSTEIICIYSYNNGKIVTIAEATA